MCHVSTHRDRCDHAPAVVALLAHRGKQHAIGIGMQHGHWIVNVENCAATSMASLWKVVFVLSLNVASWNGVMVHSLFCRGTFFRHFTLLRLPTCSLS